MRSPSQYLVIDETFYPYRGSICIKQYNPRKPAKYGLLYRSLCDAAVPYTYYTLPYAGKPSETNNETSKYYISGTNEYTKYLVNGVNHYNSIDGSKISMDRYFTLVTIAQWALKKNITIVGTMRLDRKGIPKEIKSLENREERSVFHVFDSDEKILLVSYIGKKRSGKRNIVVLSTLHDEVRVIKNERRKPDIDKLYDHTKGGLDVVDLISTSCTTRIKNKMWPINAFAFILDAVRTNAKTILQQSTTKLKISNFEFTYALGKLLVLPQIERRYANPSRIQIDLMQRNEGSWAFRM